jgi:ribosomal protein S18 acetylase RimI-like enzyme
MYQLRLLAEDDANEFWHFRLNGLKESPQAFTESAAELQSSPVDVTAQRLRQSAEGNFVVGAFADGRLVGTAGFFRNQASKTAHKGRVWGVYVDPTFRRHGIAGAMMKFLLAKIVRIDGLRQVSLTVATTQVAAIALYASLGFERVGVEPYSIRLDDSYIDEEHRILILDSVRIGEH